MRNFRNISAVAAAVICLAASYCIFAQDDLDDLLKDLESEAPKKAEDGGEKAAEPAQAEKAEEPAKAEDAKDEPAKAEEAKPAAEAEAKAEPVAEEKPAEVAAEPAAEPEAKVSEPDVKKAVATKPKDEEKPSEDVLNLLDNLAKEGEENADKPVAEKAAEPEPVAAEESQPAAPVEESQPVAAAAPETKPAAKAVAKPEDELLANIVEVEKQRRIAYDSQAMREIDAARKAMFAEEYADAIRHYSMALQFLNDAPKSKSFRIECEQGIAEGLYRYALQEDKIGRRERAIKLMDKAVDWRHPKARRQLEAWKKADDPDAYKTDVSEIKHRLNDEDYKKKRMEHRSHLRRARQLLATHELDDALFECEIVLKGDPNNEEALHVREAIQKKRKVILDQERKVTRQGMIDDVDEKWRPVYAPNARQLEEVEAKTVKKAIGADAERSPEQVLIKRMKDMILPTVEFKPPATISDAVDFFKEASRDYDNPQTPIENRGFGMYLRTLAPMISENASEDGGNDDFSDEGNDSSEESAKHGLPIIPNISVNNISFYEALKLVCDSVGYKFRVQGSIVVVMEKSMTIDEMVTRSYPVLSSFSDKIDNAANELQQQSSSPFSNTRSKNTDSDADDDQERWKKFFGEMGVEWPAGSQIKYLKTLGKLRVKNTRENLVDFEDALNELNVDQRLIEIEVRFVEVCQDDLNSLGFEWLLNADYTLGVNRKIGKILGLKNGKWGENSTTWNRAINENFTDHYTQKNKDTDTHTWDKDFTTTDTLSKNKSEILNGAGNKWARGDKTFDQFNKGKRNMGISSVNGTDYSNGNRYLSTVGNHISGESESTNDQFVKINAFLGNADLSMILHMLSQRSDTDVLSSPKVLTRPGEEADIRVVTEYIYPTDYDVQLSSSSSGGSYSRSSGNSSVLAIVEPQSFTMREVGVILTVTPNLTDDGNLIDLDLDTDVVDEPTWKNYGMKIPYSGNSSLESFTGIGEIFAGLADILNVLGASVSAATKEAIAGQATDTAMTAMNNLSTSDGNMTYYDVPMEQPFFHTRHINSKLSVYPGATIVMGGLIREERRAMDDKIPFLGDIPFIGRFFRSHSELTSKRNLLIFVTTRLVDTRGREVEVSLKDKFDGEIKAAPEVSAAE